MLDTILYNHINRWHLQSYLLIIIPSKELGICIELGKELGIGIELGKKLGIR